MYGSIFFKHCSRFVSESLKISVTLQRKSGDVYTVTLSITIKQTRNMIGDNVEYK